MKEAEIYCSFEMKVKARSTVREEGSVERLKNCSTEVSVDLYSKTKENPRHKETCWWKDDILKLVIEKRKCFLAFWKSDTATNDM